MLSRMATNQDWNKPTMSIQVLILLNHARVMCMMYEASLNSTYLQRAKLSISKAQVYKCNLTLHTKVHLALVA